MQQESGNIPASNAVRSNSGDLGRKENFANSAPNALVREVSDEQNKQLTSGRKQSPPSLPTEMIGIADSNVPLLGNGSQLNLSQITNQIAIQNPIPTANSNNPFRSTKKTQKTQK